MSGANEYCCVVQNISISQSEEIHNFIGQHEEGKSTGDVEILHLLASHIPHVPLGIHKAFPRLKILNIFNCGVREITSSVLFGLAELEQLILNSNLLRSLPDDLLVHTPKLQVIGVKDNKLEHASSRLFDPIPEEQLKFACFLRNTNIDARFWPELNDEMTLQQLKDEIDSSCFVMDAKTVENYKKLWKFRKFSDLVIIAGNTEIHAHKCVLSVQSSALSDFLDDDETTTLVIDGCNGDSVEKYLRYLYTGEGLNMDNSVEIFKVATVLADDKIRELCEEIVVANLSDDNAGDMLELANQYDSTRMLEASFDRIQTMYPAYFNFEDAKFKPEHVKEILRLQKAIEALNDK